MVYFKNICLLIGLCCITFVYSQTFSSKKIINPEPGTIRMVRSADLDGDGDQDIAVAASNFISWYENIDGQGNFSAPIAIQEGMGQSFNIALAQVDNNETIDIVVSFLDEGILAWYPNTGSGFGPMQLITNGFLGAHGVKVNDLDNDGDNDVIFSIANFSGLYWFENIDGDGNFSPPIPIDASISNARTQAVGDIDGDSDMDVLTNSTGGVFLSWYENLDGQGDFGSQIILDDTSLFQNSVNLVDLDGDNDLDILSQKSDEVIWTENISGQGDFGPINVISTEALNIFDVKYADFDNDNDVDVVSVSTDDNKVAWYENLDGQGNFGAQQIIDPDFKAPRTVHAADLDGDGDFDVLTAALEPGGGDRELVWYENLTILNQEDLQNEVVQIAPNPVDTLLTLKSTLPIQSITFYTVLGQTLTTLHKPEQNINVSFLSTGMYYITIHTSRGSVVKKLVKR